MWGSIRLQQEEKQDRGFAVDAVGRREDSKKRHKKIGTKIRVKRLWRERNGKTGNNMNLLKTYSVSNDVAGQAVKASILDKAIRDDGCVTNLHSVTLNGGDVMEILGDAIFNEAQLDSIVSNHEAVSFDDYKENKNNEIDKRTGELIGQGASFDGAVFSLSNNAQRVWIGFKLSENEHTFPVKISTIDSQRYEITDLTHLDNFWLTVMGTVKAHYTSGGDLRDLVNLAIDKAGVDAVVDNR